ncbi:hypothetical protein B0H19DRAFT_1370951 [Mycena capillaripes]|nr:hypothetical protein B0H19DRAFT_1370951 [Mycena capillaripes]
MVPRAHLDTLRPPNNKAAPECSQAHATSRWPSSAQGCLATHPDSRCLPSKSTMLREAMDAFRTRQTRYRQATPQRTHSRSPLLILIHKIMRTATKAPGPWFITLAPGFTKGLVVSGPQPITHHLSVIIMILPRNPFTVVVTFMPPPDIYRQHWYHFLLDSRRQQFSHFPIALYANAPANNQGYPPAITTPYAAPQSIPRSQSDTPYANSTGSWSRHPTMSHSMQPGQDSKSRENAKRKDRRRKLDDADDTDEADEAGGEKRGVSGLDEVLAAAEEAVEPMHDQAQDTQAGAADHASISTFVICTPDKLSYDRTAVTSEDIQVIENSSTEGGLVVSAHRPIKAEAWVENHYNDPVFTGIKGPIATMLSPAEPALAIFGSFLDDRVLSFARTLAEISGFPVMIRPIDDDPVSNFSVLDRSEETSTGGENEQDESEDWAGSENSEGEASEDFQNSEYEVDLDDGDGNGIAVQDQSSRRNIAGPALRIRGGRGDDSDEEDGQPQPPWISKAHRAAVGLKLWPDEENKYSLDIRTQTRFQLQSQYPEEDSMVTQPEVIGRVLLKVEAKATVLPDRSYTSLGFLAHRERSVIDRDFIDCGFDHPDQTLKSIDQQAVGQTVAVNAGYMNLHPDIAAAAAWSKKRTKTVELADNKPTPRCSIFHEPGERWSEGGKSYASYDITTVPGKNSTTGMKHPLKAEFVIIWISDPTLKSKVRGLLVLMTTYIPNIRTTKALELGEELEVHFATNISKKDPPPPPGNMDLSLSITPIEANKSQKNSLSELFTDIRRKWSPNKEPTLADLPLQEYISRGWDVGNGRWRSAAWTSLDKDFRNTELEASTRWKIEWKPQENDAEAVRVPVPQAVLAEGREHEPEAEIMEVDPTP